MNKFSKINVLFIFLTQFAYGNQSHLCQSPLHFSNSDIDVLFHKKTEGFLPSTLIQTVHGYVPIEQLQADDLLAGISNDEEINFSCENQILYIKQNNLTGYVQLQIDNEIINTASNQQFYLLDGTLKSAYDLEVGDVLSNKNRIYNKQIIKEPCICYSLCTKQHSFFIYPNMYVHNFNVATISASGSLILGAIEVFNPIMLLVGIVVPLAIYAAQQYQSQVASSHEFEKQDDDLSDSQSALKNIEILGQTRNYYETKRKALLNIYQNLVNIKNDLAIFIRPNYFNALAFSSGFLQQFQLVTFNFAALPNISYEAALSLADKEKLIKIRDAELEKLQQEILDLHLILAFHISEIIERRDQAQQDLDIVVNRVNDSVNCWNQNLYDIPYDVALHEYEIHFAWREILNHLETKTNEVKWILIYYEKLKNHFFVSQTTTLLNLLTEQIKINAANFERIKTHRNTLLSNTIIHENFLREHGFLSQQLINQYQAAAQKYRKEIENSQNSIIDAKKKQASAQDILKKSIKNQGSIASTGGPDPDDDWFKKLQKTADKTARHERFGKFYRDPQSKLWWSKDNGSNHAGPHYKVFQERATGLEWIWDIDLVGKIMNKHKSPTGMFIPYKELIFLS